MLIIPIKHEGMWATRWPIITFAFIAINTLVLLFTSNTQLEQRTAELSTVRAHIRLLAAMHPQLTVSAEVRPVIDKFREANPHLWEKMHDGTIDVMDGWDARMRLAVEEGPLQEEMDSLAAQYKQLVSATEEEGYAFIPAHPSPISYLTANFLHGGWMHLIGNMWFLWLAGFVLEDVWGRWLYSVFYLIAGAAALQFYAWTNPGSITPTLGASGAVAALMGAFLVRLPKMKIEMAWLFWFRIYRFKAAAYWLLPLWLLGEIFYGALFGSMSGVAHWAHVGGFLFGAVAAVAIRHSGLEQKANKAIEEKLGWSNDPELELASSNMEHGQLADAIAHLNAYVAKKPNSVDAWNMLRQIYTRQNDMKSYLEATVKSCALHLRAHEVEAAFQDYAEFVDNGGGKMPAATWLELCKGAEEKQEFERALTEYQQLAAAYPAERQALTAQLSAARLCLKRLGRPADALALYQAAAASPIPHLDWEQHIQSGLKEAKGALGGGTAAAASAP